MGAQLRQWREDERLTGDMVATRYEPGEWAPNKTRISEIENGKGDFSIHGLKALCRALNHSLSELLVLTDDYEAFKWGGDREVFTRGSLAAIRADPDLLAGEKRMLIAAVEQGHANARAERESRQSAAKRRDAARNVGVDDALVRAWPTLTEERRRQVLAFVLGESAMAEEPEAAPAEPKRRGRRRPTA